MGIFSKEFADVLTVMNFNSIYEIIDGACFDNLNEEIYEFLLKTKTKSTLFARPR